MESESKKLVLASSSPRRRQLLSETGIPFEIIEPDESAECGLCSGESPPELVARLAFQKAANVAAKLENGLVLAADTVADCHGQILGKPSDERHAREMLQQLAGSVHKVLTGVCLWDRPTDRQEGFVDVTTLRMDPLTENQMEAYLATDQWVGKAGAFGYQDGLDWVHIIEGDASNVVGLPIARTLKLIESFRV